MCLIDDVGGVAGLFGSVALGCRRVWLSKCLAPEGCLGNELSARRAPWSWCGSKEANAEATGICCDQECLPRPPM
jgi:hypothetical protein